MSILDKTQLKTDKERLLGMIQEIQRELQRLQTEIQQKQIEVIKYQGALAYIDDNLKEVK